MGLYAIDADPVVEAGLSESRWLHIHPHASFMDIKDREFSLEYANLSNGPKQNEEDRKAINLLLELGVSLRFLIRSPNPENHTYTPVDHEFIRVQLMNVGYFTQQRLPHSLREVSRDDLIKANKYLANPHESADKTKWAKQTILHAKIPWRLFESLTFHLLKNSGEEGKKIPLIMFQAWEELRTDFRTILQYRDNLLRAYVNADLVSLEGHDLSQEAFFDIPTFTLVGGYYRDQAFWQKLQREVFVLDHLGGKAFREKEAKYAFFRLITVIGETGKSLSPHIKRLLPHDIWRVAAKVRDSFHNPRGYRRFFRMVEQESRNRFYVFVPELKRFREEISPIFEKYDSFETLKKEYCQVDPHKSFVQADALIFLKRYLRNILPHEREQELLNTFDTRISSIEEPVELMTKMLLGEESIDRTVFEERISLVPSFTKADKKHLYETVKKKTSGQNVGQKRLGKCTKILEKQTIPGENEAQNKLQEILQEFGKYVERSSDGNKTAQWGLLEKELIPLGITDLYPWKQALTELVGPVHGSGKSRVSAIIHNILKATDTIEEIMRRNSHLPQTWRFDHFWNDPFLPSAVDFLFGCFREESTILIQELKNPAFVFPLSVTKPHRDMIIYSLTYQIEAAKGTFHLHEVQDIKSVGVTPHGWKFNTYNSIFNFMEGWGTVLSHGSIVPVPTLLRNLLRRLEEEDS